MALFLISKIKFMGVWLVSVNIEKVSYQHYHMAIGKFVYWIEVLDNMNWNCSECGQFLF